MATSLTFLLFGTLIVVGVFAMVKIQRAELLAARAEKDFAREAERIREARMKDYRAKCYRPDGD